MAEQRILIGDVRAMLKTIDDESVHLVVTSPPYLGLRSYSTEPQLWAMTEEQERCEHAWVDVIPGRKRDRQHMKELSDRYRGGGNKASSVAHTIDSSGAFCLRCSCWRGELGGEPSVELFVQHLVAVFRDVRRVLRKDGVCFLNISDSYAGTHQTRTASPQFDGRESLWRPEDNRPVERSIPAKNLLLVPAALALALRADGWYVRSIMPWIKWQACMPESAKDRPTAAHEWVLMLTRQKSYYWDQVAASRVGAEPERQRWEAIGGKNGHTVRHSPGGMMGSTSARNYRTADAFLDALDTTIAETRARLAHLEAVRARGGLLTDDDGDPLALLVNPGRFPDSHFATFPLNLIRPLIAAGSSERGVCGECGAPWRRMVKKSGGTTGKGWHNHENDAVRGHRGGDEHNIAAAAWPQGNYRVKTLGWSPTCQCDAGDPIPATVLDPFLGSGTTLVVAAQLERSGIGIELSPEYAAMAEKRIREEGSPLLSTVEVEANGHAPAARQAEMFGGNS